ncbi:MAG: phosphoglycerate dehydrogenase [Terriglobia bacterium]
MMKILVSDNVSESALGILRAESSFNVVYLAGKKDGVKEEIRDAEALVIRSATKVTADLLATAPKLRAIGRAGVGIDNVDLDAATQKGIVVMNTPGGNAASVAEQTLGFMLALARHIPQANASMKAGQWEKKKFMGYELRGKRLGLIGLGMIGMDVARLAQAFQMEVIAHDPFVSSLVASQQNVKLVSLEKVLRSSDYISLHCSATPETLGLLNGHTLSMTKKGVRIVNCARGELICEADLLQALESGQVAGAALDVFQKEPPADTRLVNHPEVVVTPHIAGSTEEAQEIVGIRIAEQVRDYLLQGVARNAVNLPSISAEEYKKLGPYLQLGEKLGSFIGQIVKGGPTEVRISYDGGLADLNTHLVKNSVLKGLLNQVLSEETQANLINAGTLAQSRAIEVNELRSARRAAFSNSLGISLRAGEGSASVLGMVGPQDSLRILGINDIDIEAPLKGTILYIRNQDVPGVIGRVGTVLGEAKVNIANFNLGRNPQLKEAIGLVSVDQNVPDGILKEIQAISAVRLARVIKLD